MEMFLAVVFAVAAAARLVFFRWHVRADRKWLVERFGESDDATAIVETHSLIIAVIFAAASVMFVFA
jgi:hypothetical protein